MSKTKSNADIVLIVALTEEAEVFEDNDLIKLEEPKQLENFSYSWFSFFDTSKNEKRGIAVMVGEVGTRAREAAFLFAREFKPHFVINIGISGRAGKDASVGDIVVPSMLNLFDHRGSIVDDEEDGYEFKVGGKWLESDRGIIGLISHPNFASLATFPTLLNFAKEKGVRLSSDEKVSIGNWRDTKDISPRPKIVLGPFAVSSNVNKSRNFTDEVLASANRNVIAIDMESALVADALLSLESCPRFFSIRAISDPGDARKSKFDAIGNGIMRRWAMSNILRCLTTLIEKTRLLDQASDDIEVAQSVSSSHYQANYPGQRIGANLNDEILGQRFLNLRQNQTEAPQVPITFAELIEKVTDAGRDPEADHNFLVLGHGGCGKSALLMSAKRTVEAKCPDDLCVFLSMKTLRKDMVKRDIVAGVKKNIRDECGTDWASDQKVFVFLDELYGDDAERGIIRAIQTIFKSNHLTILFAFGVDHFEVLRLSFSENSTPYVYDFAFNGEFELKNTQLQNEAEAEALIGGIAQSSNLVHLTPPPNEVLDEIKKLGFKYINHFVISLYLYNCRKLAYQRLTTSTDFVLKAMRDTLDELAIEMATAPTFEDICVEALRAHNREFRRSQLSEERAQIRSSYEEHFGHYPKLVQSALVAKAITHLLKVSVSNEEAFDEYELDEDTFFGLVFSDHINACVKDILKDRNIEQGVMQAAERLFEKLDEENFPFALYLAGRATSNKGKQIAKRIMNSAVDVVMSDLPVRSDSVITDLSSIDREEKFRRLGRRTLFISWAMSGNAKYTDEYIEHVLSDRTEDLLNQYFHMEYYGDHPNTGISVELAFEESGTTWARTRRALLTKINAMLENRRATQYDRIAVLTFFTIARSKHETGELGTKTREHCLTVLEQIEASPINLGARLTAFLRMMRHVLQFDSFTAIDAILDLYELKSIARSGWVGRKMAPDAPVIESVGAHTFGAMLLAIISAEFLELDIEDELEVLRLLAVHDIGEAYIGDYPPHDGETKAREAEAVARISSLSSYGGLRRLGMVKEWFESFETMSSEPAKIAHDLDKLDALLQGWMYYDRFPDVEDREEFLSYQLDQIKTPQLRAIAESVMRRASREADVGGNDDET